MKTKTYILTLSTHFPKGHPREGEETNFAEKAKWGIDWYGIDERCLEAERKIHTIRANYELWKKRIDEVNAGRAVLSVRQWLGAPRRSKQRELFRLDRDSGIGVEKLVIGKYLVIRNEPKRHMWRKVENGAGGGELVDDYELASNDGLTHMDWLAWFADQRYDLSQPMAIIHFTKFRYCK